MKLWQFIVPAVFIVAVALYMALTLHQRHNHANPDQIAWFITLPGYRERCSHEHTVDLRDWVGSEIQGVTAEVDGERDPEVEAAMALKAQGVYGNEYILERRDDHWVLYKPEEVTRYFTLQAFYRVTSWVTKPSTRR